MIGELDFANIFAQDVTNAGIPPTFQMPYPGVTVFFFVLFLVLLPILFMNLLVGLAVDNIQSVQDKAVLERLAMQVRLNLDVERMLPTFLHKKYIVKGEKVYPNKPESMFLNILNDNNNLRRIANAIVAKETDVSQFLLKWLGEGHKIIQSSFQTEIELILQKLNKVSEDMKKMDNEMKEKFEMITKAMPEVDESDEQSSAVTRSSALSGEMRRYMT